jgi:hypothetical protein
MPMGRRAATVRARSAYRWQSCAAPRSAAWRASHASGWPTSSSWPVASARRSASVAVAAPRRPPPEQQLGQGQPGTRDRHDAHLAGLPRAGHD